MILRTENRKNQITRMTIVTLISLIIGLTDFFYCFLTFSTWTKRNGLFGGLYSYYRMTINQFAVYNLSIAFIESTIFILIIRFFINRNYKNFKSVILSFLIIFIIIALSEIYLQTRFIEKG